MRGRRPAHSAQTLIEDSGGAMSFSGRENASMRVASESGPRRDLAGIALGAGAAVAFGTLAVSAKYAYDAGADPAPLLATRFALAAGLLVAYHALLRRSLVVAPPLLMKLVLAGGLLYGLEASLFFAALEHAPAGVVTLVFYSYPLWTTLLAFGTRLEPLHWRLIVALLLGSTGVVLVFSLPATGLAGPLLAVGAAVTVAVYILYMQVLLEGVAPSVAAMWTSAGAALAVGSAGLLTGQQMPPAAFPWAGALAVASAIAFAALYESIARIGSSRAAVAAMLEPVTTVILAALFLGEVLTTRILIGAALVVGTLPMLAGRRRVDGTSPPHDTAS